MTKKEIKKINKDLVKIITESKAIFFTDKISAKEVLYELKATICTNVEMYFYNLLNK